MQGEGNSLLSIQQLVNCSGCLTYLSLSQDTDEQIHLHFLQRVLGSVQSGESLQFRVQHKIGLGGIVGTFDIFWHPAADVELVLP